MEFKDYAFVPEVKESGNLYIQAEIYVDGKRQTTLNKTISMYMESEGRRVEVSLDTDKEYIAAKTDEVNVKFSVEGVGSKEENERKPLDIFVCLDNSWSMSFKDWDQAQLAAEQIVGYMQSYDRCTIQYIGDDYTKCELTSDKEELIRVINMGGLSIYGGTKVDRSINLAIDKLKETPLSREKVYLLLSDGAPNNREAAIASAEKAVTEGFKIYTLGLRANGEEFLKEIAEMGSGKYIYSPTNEELVDFMVDIAGDIFVMAGKEATLSVELGEDVSYEDIVINPQPDTVTENEDGTVSVIWKKDYVSLGEMFYYTIKFNTNMRKEGSVVKLINGAELSYTDMFDEKVMIKMEDVNVRVKSTEEEESETSQEESYVTVDENAIIAPETSYKEDVERVKVKGEILVSDREVFTGTGIEVSFEAVNHGTKALENADFKVNIINVKTQETTVLREEKYNIDINNGVTGQAGIETQNLEEGEYLVTLNGTFEGEQILLGATSFSITEPLYNFNVIAESGGTVNADVQGPCKENTGIELTATPDSGYVFAGWSSDNGGVFENEYSEITTFITPGNDTIVKAVFVKQKYEVIVEAGNGGRIVGEISGDYEEGTKIELSAKAFSGYDFNCWTVSGEGTIDDERNINTTFTTGKGVATVTALFSEKESEGEAEETITTQGNSETGKSSGYTENSNNNTKDDAVSTKNDSTGLHVENQTFKEQETVNKESEKTATNDLEENTSRNNTKSKDKSEDKHQSESSQTGENKSFFDAVKTGDFAERAVIIRNITFMLFIVVIVSLVVLRRSDDERSS